MLIQKYIPAWSIGWGVGIGLYFVNMYTGFLKRIVKMWNDLDDILNMMFSPKFYMFFDDSVFPYEFRISQARASGSAIPSLIYNTDSKLFFPWSEEASFNEIMQNDSYELPVLSLEIVDKDGKVAYDLTDFIEKIKYIDMSGAEIPAIGHIIAVWQLSSKIILDTHQFSVRYIDANGNTLKTHLRDSTSFFDDHEASSEFNPQNIAMRSLYVMRSL